MRIKLEDTEQPVWFWMASLTRLAVAGAKLEDSYSQLSCII